MALLLPIVTTTAQTLPGSRHTPDSDSLRFLFADPPASFAPFFFWFWDTPLDEEKTRDNLVRMAEKMLAQRMNPGYVHARFNMVGLPDLPREQWLSPLWFEAFRRVAAVAEADAGFIGMCGDFWWPSGQAAGRVLKSHPDLWATSLYWQTIEVAGGKSVRVPASFFVIAAQLIGTADSSSSSLIDHPTLQTDDEILLTLSQQKNRLKRVKTEPALKVVPHVPAIIKSQTLKLIGADAPFDWQAPAGSSWRLYVFHQYFHPGCDGGRLNFLDRRLASAFIHEALQPYAEQMGSALGSTIPGIFLDHEGDDGYKLAWSNDLSNLYSQKTGSDIRLHLPLLFDTDKEGYYFKARWDWYDAVSDLYAGYFKEINDWCWDHHLWCISNLWEETLMWQAGAVGDFFKAQKSFSMPGTDALGLNVLQPHDFMETRSICEFENRRQQSEIMGGSGFWGFSPITIKQAANAAICWGVNHIVPHAVFATRKLDGNPWLPDWFDQQPLWPLLHLWSDFLRRAGFVNSCGQSSADVLLLNPMDSVWGWSGAGVFDPAFPGRVPVPAIMPLPQQNDIDQSAEEMKRLSAWWCPPLMDNWFNERSQNINKIYAQAIDDLTRQRIEYLIADRHYLQQMITEGAELVRTPFRFRTVILPAMTMISRENARKLLAFAQNGGHIILLHTIPSASMEAGLEDAEVKQFMRQLIAQKNVSFLADARIDLENVKCKQALSPHVFFQMGDFPLLQQHRRINDNDFFWLVNNSETRQSCRLLFPHLHGSATKWNCETGEIQPLASTDHPEGTSINLTFESYEAFWLVIEQQQSPQAAFESFRETIILELDGEWSISINPEIQPPGEHPFNFAGLEQRQWVSALQPCSAWGLDSLSGYVEYEKHFTLAQTQGRIILDLGKVLNCAQIYLNGELAGERLWPPYRIDISQNLHEGDNQLNIRIGNLLNNSYGDAQEFGLLGPVVIEQLFSR